MRDFWLLLLCRRSYLISNHNCLQTPVVFHVLEGTFDSCCVPPLSLIPFPPLPALPAFSPDCSSCLRVSLSRHFIVRRFRRRRIPQHRGMEYYFDPAADAFSSSILSDTDVGMFSMHGVPSTPLASHPPTPSRTESSSNSFSSVQSLMRWHGGDSRDSFISTATSSGGFPSPMASGQRPPLQPLSGAAGAYPQGTVARQQRLRHRSSSSSSFAFHPGISGTVQQQGGGAASPNSYLGDSTQAPSAPSTSSSTATKSYPSFSRPQPIRCLPARPITSEEALTPAYIQFCLYCNPSVPMDPPRAGLAELEKAFNNVPKSGDRLFKTWDLYLLMQKLETGACIHPIYSTLARSQELGFR